MKVINSKEEFNQFYHHYNGGKYLPKKYPSKYPCVCKKEHHDGGLGGDYTAHYAAYFPKTRSPDEAFMIGLNTEWEYLC